MDAPQYTNLCAALAAVPDPRQRRGQRYAWPVLLTVIAAAVVSGQQGMRAIGQWVAEHADELGPMLGLVPGRIPSAATLRRAVRAVDLAALEAHLAAFVAALPPPPPPAPATVSHARSPAMGRAGPRWQSGAGSQPAWRGGPSGQPGPP